MTIQVTGAIKKSEPKIIAVIGAGASGLSAIKCCKEEGLRVVCFEKTSSLGGLWRYHEDDIDGVPSVMKTTVINTSKELSAFSDFPPPKEFPVFLHHTKMVQYFEMYANSFGLNDHIQYNSDVQKIVQASDYEETGRWTVTVRNVQDDTVKRKTFDGVMVCTGHHVMPVMPVLPGQEKFRGKIFHSHSIKTNLPFTDLNVVVVGVGNSGLDVSTELSNSAKQVYLSTRRGTWILGKTHDRGIPSDAIIFTRLYDILRKAAGCKLSNYFTERMANQRYDHTFLGIKPKHRIISQHPCANELLPIKILSGAVIIKKDIKTFTENGVIFEDETSETPADAVVFATGYHISFPFLDKTILDTSHNKVDLYKFAFPPDLKHPSLVFIGLFQPFGSIFPISENQSRWYALVVNGKVHLPNKETMKAHMQNTKRKNAERFVDSLRHTIQVDFTDFMDQVSEEYGAKPKLLKYFFTDPPVYWACLLNPTVAYQYRLNGPHSWSGARDALLGYNYRMSYSMRHKGGEKFKYRMWFPYEPVIFYICIPIFLFLIFVFICWKMLSRFV